MLKCLNLYAGIGGNRKLWQDVEVTAVEIKEEIAKIYQNFFPNDNVIIGDAHEYLLQHFQEYDFIWSSPPCPSHSKFRFMTTKMTNEKYKRPIVFPDMKLYQEILLLKHYFEGLWVIENVVSYYEPLIPAEKIARHLFWANYNIGKLDGKPFDIKYNSVKDLEQMHGFDLSKFKIKYRKDQILRNCVAPEIGLYIFSCALGKNLIKKDLQQQTLFGWNHNA